jgi:hypothetical protein
VSVGLFDKELSPEELKHASAMVAETPPPDRLKRYCERWSALMFDEGCGEPIGWGYVLAEWTPRELDPLFASAGTTVYLGDIRVGLETVRITRASHPSSTARTHLTGTNSRGGEGR